MSDEKSPQLSLADPVDKATLIKLGELENGRLQVGAQLLDLEQEKIKLMTAAHRLDEQRTRVYEKILIDRGIGGHEPVEIDAETGKVTLLRPPKPADESPEG